MPNPYTGHQAPGFRFCFHVRSISHRPLFLPKEMRLLPEIQRLLKGESPLAVFHRHDISSAREAFNDLRKHFDFPYWAVKDYYIRDIRDADYIIPLKLNLPQRYLIDILFKRYQNRQVGRYVVTKTLRPCGLTTCVQAYITWLQTFRCRNNSYMCSSSDINLNPHKTDLCRWLKRDIVPSEKWIFVPSADSRAFFNTYRSPDFIRGINIGYVHFADMSKWNSPDGDLASRVVSAATGGVLLEYFTLIIYEGNIPQRNRFQPETYGKLNLPRDCRLMELSALSKNPYFLNYAALAATPIKGVDPIPLHIDLDDAFFPSRQLKIQLKGSVYEPEHARSKKFLHQLCAIRGIHSNNALTLPLETRSNDHTVRRDGQRAALHGDSASQPTLTPRVVSQE